MIITLTSTKIRKKDTIQEIFTWSPGTRFAYDDSRQLMKKLKLKIAQVSLHINNYNIKLIDINYFENSILFTYNIIGDLNLTNSIDSYEIIYYPILGTKTCKNCCNLKLWNHQLVCLLKIFPIEKLKGCISWEETENRNSEKIRKANVYNRQTTSRNGRSHR